MSVTKETIEMIAGLAKIGLSRDEAERYAPEIGRIAGFADTLADLDVGNVAPSTHSVPLQSVFRDDVREVPLPREELLANAPEHDEACFLAPKVLE